MIFLLKIFYEIEVKIIMSMTLEEKRQLAIQSLKEKMINKMKKIKSSDDTIENILYNISDEAERNLLRIFNYCHRQFEYQCKYFELNNTIFIPNIYCNKNKTFYILNFINQYTGSDRKKIINEFINLYPNEKIKLISLKQYRKIIKWFRDDILFESSKYKINFSLDNKKRIKCNYCGTKFTSNNKKDKYCSEECAINAHNNKTNKSIIRHYYSGYYMDIHHYVRSGWEHNIARILQWSQLNYDYECHTFKLSNGTTYTPDFYIYADNTFYEVKGEMRTNTLTKYNMFKEEYPEKKLIIIDGKIYQDLLEQYTNIDFNQYQYNQYQTLPYTINNINQYRVSNIKYEMWELDYKFYTNKRYNNSKSIAADENINNFINIKELANNNYLLKNIAIKTIRYMHINNEFFIFKDDIQINSTNKQATIIQHNTSLPEIFHKCLQKILPNKYIVICQNCKKQYISNYIAYNKPQICRDCYQIIYNNTDIKRQQANKMLIKNLKHIHWHINDNHIQFNNEAENNFALILEYLNNEYTYEDDYRYIDNYQYIYQFNFFRNKNNTIYILEFCLTYTIRLRVKSFLNEYNEKVHIITRKKYERILKFFNTKINFTYNQYPLQYYVLHICPICNNNFYANIQQIYCSSQCKHKSMNKQYKEIRTNLYQYKLTDEQLNNLQCTNLQATNKKLLKQMHNLNSNNIDINNINLPNEEINFIKVLQYLKLEFYYKTEYKKLSTGKILIMKFYLPVDNHYYFLTFVYNRNYINKIKQYIIENENNNCILIDKYIYEQLLQQYKNKIDFIQTTICTLNNNQIVNKCKYCGKELSTVKKQHLYCSRKCYELAKRKYIKKSCINCNNKFLVLDDDINNQYFCSSKCGEEYKQKIQNNNKLSVITENNIIKKFYNTQCEYCHKQHYYFGTRKHKYCSNICKRKTNANK